MTPSATFAEKLAAAAERNRSWLCVGLDPQPGRTPLDEIVPFTRAIIDATSDLVCAFKPQAAFFEAHGRAGWDALAATIAAVPDHVPVVLDAKRGDIGHVAEAYATACFDALGADAVTVNPYLGRDAVAPFLARPDKGAFILCRTSNAGGADLQASTWAASRCTCASRRWSRSGAPSITTRGSSWGRPTRGSWPPCAIAPPGCPSCCPASGRRAATWKRRCGRAAAAVACWSAPRDR